MSLGATVIEKHLTFDRSLPGPDHAASLEPSQLTELVRCIRSVRSALGSPRKVPVADEVGNRPLGRRSLVAARPIARGERYTADMLIAKRPAR